MRISSSVNNHNNTKRMQATTSRFFKEEDEDQRQWSGSASDSSLVSTISMEPRSDKPVSLPSSLLLVFEKPQRDDDDENSSTTTLLYEPSDWDDEQPKPIPLKRTIRELEAAIQRYGPNHMQVASLWSALGLIRHHMQHLTAAAVKCHHAAIDIYRNLQNEENDSQQIRIDLAVALTDLGRCYEYLNESDKSIVLYQEAAEILESSHQQSCFLQSVKRAQARLERR